MRKRACVSPEALWHTQAEVEDISSCQSFFFLRLPLYFATSIHLEKLKKSEDNFRLFCLCFLDNFAQWRIIIKSFFKISSFIFSCPKIWFLISCWSVNLSRRHMDAGQRTCRQWTRHLTQHFMLMTRPMTFPYPALTSRTTLFKQNRAHPSLEVLLIYWGGLFDRMWKTGVFLGACVLLLCLHLGAESRSSWGKSMTFHRSRGEVRPRRESSSSSDTWKPSHGPAFNSCRIPLTTAEHKVLDDNTHEVNWIMCVKSHLLIINPTIWDWE